jgi:hypothetical protein
VALALLVLLVAAACRDRSLTLIPRDQLPDDVYGSPPPIPTERIPEEGNVYLIREGSLEPLPRSLSPSAATIPEALLLALIQAQSVPDLESAVPAETRINDLDVDRGIANVDLSEEFEVGGTGRSLALRVAQVVYTLTEDERIFAVLFSIGGRPEGVTIAGGEVVDRAVTRDDFAAFLPEEEPQEGAEETPEEETPAEETPEG